MPTIELEIPESLHRGIKEPATKNGYSLTQFFITAAAEKLSAIATEDYLSQRAKRVDLTAFDQILAQVLATTPDEGDELF